jgi:hypothetical protein
MQSRLRPPRVTSTRVVYENRWMRVHEDRLEREDGSPGLYGWIEKGPSAIIVPLDGNHVWLVEAEEVLLQRLHPGRRDEDGLIPVGRDQRPARELLVPRGVEVVDKPAADLVGAHVRAHSTGGYPLPHAWG